MASLPSAPHHAVRALLSKLGVTQAQLGAAAGVSRLRINQICAFGQRITPNIAARLEIVAGLDAERVLMAQMRWDLERARDDVKKLRLTKL